MKPKETEFEKFDRVTRGIFTIPNAEMQRKLKEEKRAKDKHQKQSTSTASHVSASNKKINRVTRAALSFTRDKLSRSDTQTLRMMNRAHYSRKT